MKSPIACNFGALNPEQQSRYKEIQHQLKKVEIRIDELSEGYSFVYPNEEEAVMYLTEWISIERICCPFPDFSLDLRSNQQAVLTLSGSESIKMVLKEEFRL